MSIVVNTDVSEANKSSIINDVISLIDHTEISTSLLALINGIPQRVGVLTGFHPTHTTTSKPQLLTLLMWAMQAMNM